MSHHNIVWVDIHVYTSIQVELLCLKFIESSHTFNKYSPDTARRYLSMTSAVTGDIGVGEDKA